MSYYEYGNYITRKMTIYFQLISSKGARVYFQAQIGLFAWSMVIATRGGHRLSHVIAVNSEPTERLFITFHRLSILLTGLIFRSHNTCMAHQIYIGLWQSYSPHLLVNIFYWFLYILTSFIGNYPHFLCHVPMLYFTEQLVLQFL